MSHDVPPFPQEYRASGVLLHVTSLPSPYGIGDVGPVAFSWVDRLHDAGQSWWQALPLGPTGYGDSPYQALSSFAGNALLISPDWLIEDGLVRASDCADHSFPPTKVDFDAVKRFKHSLLEAAWRNFSAGLRADLQPAFEEFGQTQAHWLDDYALFRVLKERHGGAPYLDWPAELVRRNPAALDRARRDLARGVDQVRFSQFLLFRQGARLKEHARARGVRLIGDLPFFVSPDSSDVWANPELFLLDDHARPALVVEQEELRIGPHVARVRGDEKGQIADQTHASSAGVFLQARALAEQEELAEADLVDSSREIPACPIERGRVPPDELRRPIEIRRASVPLLERAEQGVIVQPVGLRLAELLERRLQVRAQAGTEVPPRCLEQ